MVESASRFFLYLCFLLFRRFLAEADVSDFDPRQLPAMADCSVITFPATVFKSDHFLVLALFDDFAGNGGAFDQRVSMRKLLAVAVKKHIREHTFFASFFVQEVHINDVAFGDSMLSAPCFDNCVGHIRGKVAQSHMRRGF